MCVMNSDVGRRYIRRRGDAEGVEVDCGGGETDTPVEDLKMQIESIWDCLDDLRDVIERMDKKQQK